MANFFDKLKKVKTNQTVALRDESKQVYKKREGIKSLEYDKNKISRVLVLKQLKMPFNPVTGEEDETFNYSNPFRTNMSITSTLKQLIPLWKEDIEQAREEGRESVLDRINDITGADLTEEDLDNEKVLHKALREIELPQIFTLPAITINCKAVTNSDYARKYVVDFDRDAWEALPSEEKAQKRPLWDLFNGLFLTRARIEVNELEENAEYLAKSDDDKKSARKVIWSKNPIATERPVNWCLAFEFPLDEEEFTIEGGLASFSEEKIRKCLRLVKLNKGLSSALADIKPEGKTHKRDDSYVDFYEFEFSCGEEDPKTDMGQLVMNSKFQTPKDGLDREEGYEEFIARLNKVIDSLTDNGEKSLDEFVKPHLRASVYTGAVEEKLIQALRTLYPFEEMKNVLQKDEDAMRFQAKALSLLYEDQFDGSLIESVSAEEEDAKAKQLRDLAKGDVGTTEQEDFDKQFAEDSMGSSVFENVEV